MALDSTSFTQIAWNLRDAASTLENGRELFFCPLYGSLKSDRPSHVRWKNRVCHLIWERSGGGDKGDGYGEKALMGEINIPKTIIIEALRMCADEVPVLVHTWEVKSFVEEPCDEIYKPCSVRLFQSRTEVICQLFLSNREYVKKEYNIPLGGNDPDILVRNLKQYEVDIGNARANVFGFAEISEQLDFFPYPRTPIYSLLDTSLNSRRILDFNTFAVTIADTGDVNAENIATWGGHAVLIYEGVKRGRYFMHMAHLTKKNGVELFDSNDFHIPLAKAHNNAQELLEGVKGKSQTVYVNADKIVHLIKSIIVDIKNRKTEFLITGGDSIVAGITNAWEFIKLVASGRGFDKRFHNCFTWVIENVKAIGLESPPNPKDWLISMPKDHIPQMTIQLKSQINSFSSNTFISGNIIKSSI